MVKMKLKINGEFVTVSAETTLASMITEKGLNAAKVLASINGEIIQPDAYDKKILQEGDMIELFSFVSGG